MGLGWRGWAWLRRRPAAHRRGRGNRCRYVDGFDDGSLVRQRDGGQCAVGTDRDRSILRSRRQRKWIQHRRGRVQPVPRARAKHPHGDQSVRPGRSPFREEGRLGGRLGEHPQSGRWARQIEGVDLVVGAAAGGQSDVTRVRDQAERPFALEVGGCRQRLDRAGEGIGAEEPVVRNHSRRGGPALGRPFVVDGEVQNRIRHAGRRRPHRPRDAESPACRQRSHQSRFAGCRIEHANAFVAQVRDEPLAQGALHRRRRVGHDRRASAASACWNDK